MRAGERASTATLRALLRPIVRGRRRQLVGIGVLSLVNGLADAAVLVIVARVAFALTEAHGTVVVTLGPLGEVRIPIEYLLGIAAAVVVVKFASQVAVARMSSRISPAYTSEHRARITRAFLASSWPVQSEEREGHLQELVTSYTTQSATALASLITFGVAISSLVGLLGAALVINPVGALVAAIVVAGLGYAFRPVRKRVRAASRHSAQANMDFATATTEVAGEAQEIRVFDVGTDVQRRLDEAAARHRRAAERVLFLNSAVTATYQNVALLFLLGALLAVSLAGVSNLAALGGIVLILLRSLSYGQTSVSAYYTMQQQAPLIERLQEEEERLALAQVDAGGDHVPAIESLAFEDVSFSYTAGQRVLQGVSFSTRRGDVIGIIGPSGAGKSTLVQLLLRLRTPVAGRILADGRDVKTLALADWYRFVGFVPQEPRLFAGTVAENIRFFRPAEDGRVEDAARRAHIHDEILRLPRGYETSVGERGGRLSGGQRQRICIARALVGDPDVVVFDEPTSALDVRSEALIRETLVELSVGAIVFIVAHRLSTLEICDRIMVLQDGELRGFDEPGRLEIQNPFYAEALQLSGLR